MDKKELNFILQEREYLNLNKELIIIQNLESSSLGLSTSTPDNSLSDLSPENIGHFNSSANATYCTSFKCFEASFVALGKDLENSSSGMSVICSVIKSRTLSNSSLSNPDLLRNISLCLSNSVNKNSGATKSNLLSKKLSSNTFNESPFVNNEERTTLTSTTTLSNTNHLLEDLANNPLYLLANEILISSEISSTSSSVNLDLATILCTSEILSNLDLINLLANIDQSISETCLKNPISSGILIFNSAIHDSSKKDYINISKENLGKIAVRRNPLLFDMSSRLDLIEKAGSGINRIKNSIKKRGLKIKFEIDGFFKIIFSGSGDEETNLDDKKLSSDLLSYNIKEEDIVLIIFASIFSLDYLVTFNRKHLKNNQKEINEVLKKNGLEAIKIVLPDEI